MLYRKTGLYRTLLVEGNEKFIYNIYTQKDACAAVKTVFGAIGCIADSAVFGKYLFFFFF